MKITYLFEIIVLGSPLVFGLLSEFFMYMADSAMVGRLGTEYLAAIGIATLFTEILWVIVWPLAPATQAIASRRYGREFLSTEQSREAKQAAGLKTGEVLDNAVIVGMLAGFLAVAIGAFAEDMLLVFLDDETVVMRAMAYISVLKWIMPLGGGFYVLYGFLAAVNLTTPIMIASVGLNILNIIFNYILIFGKFGFPALGITGSALATVAAECIGTVFLVLFLICSTKLKHFEFFRFRFLKLHLIRDIAACATPVACQMVLVLSMFLYYETLVANIGTIYLAITHILFTLLQLKRTVVGGFAEGGAALIGNFLGQGHKQKAFDYALGCEVLALVLGGAIFGCLLMFPEWIVRIFNHEPETVALGAKVIKIFAFFLFFEIMAFPFEVIFSHNGWGRYTLFAELSAGLICIIGLTLFFIKVLDQGIYSAWSAFALFMLLHALLLMAGFLSKKWMDVRVEHV